MQCGHHLVTRQVRMVFTLSKGGYISVRPGVAAGGKSSVYWRYYTLPVICDSFKCLFFFLHGDWVITDVHGLAPSQWCCWMFRSSWMLCCIPDVSCHPSAIRLLDPENEGTAIVGNFRNCLPFDTVVQPKDGILNYRYVKKKRYYCSGIFLALTMASI